MVSDCGYLNFQVVDSIYIFGLDWMFHIVTDMKERQVSERW